MTKTTANRLQHRAPHSASCLQRAAVFDSDGRLMWSSSYQPVGEAAAPLSTIRCGASHGQLLQQWWVDSGAGSGLGECGWHGLAWDDEFELRVSTESGDDYQLVQRRTPDGGTLVLLIRLFAERVTTSAPAATRSDGSEMRLGMTEAISWLSQELRTPFNSILGFAQLMQRDMNEPLTPRHRSRADEIVKAGEQVVGLLGKLLELCRAELGRVSIQRVPTDPRLVVRAACASVAPIAARAGVELRTGANAVSVSPRVLVDPAQLQQILETLLLRAIEQPRRPAFVAIELTMPRDGVARITVSDDGSGIHPEAQATLLLPFRKQRGTDGMEATGLALASAHRLAELMRCQLRFSSVSGRGTDFWVEIPAG